MSADAMKLISRMVLVFTYSYCAYVFLAILGTIFGKVDVQYVEGLITGLLSTIVMLCKDIIHINQEETNGKETIASVVPVVAAEPK